MIARHPGQCKPHEYQDKAYGPGVRVMNPARVKNDIVGGRCTVCCPPKEHSKRRGGIYPLNELLIVRK